MWFYVYAFTVATEVDRECSDDFFLDNSSGLCRPECGEWEQYTPSTRSAVVGINITFVFITILICVATFVWSVVRHKIMWAILHYMLVAPPLLHHFDMCGHFGVVCQSFDTRSWIMWDWSVGYTVLLAPLLHHLICVMHDHLCVARCSTHDHV